jgi:hypothetical protein
MLYDVVEAKALANYKVWVRFEDGVEGVADLSHLAGHGVFKRWSDNPAEFAQVTVDPESGTLVWPGGLDVAPDRLYQDIVGPTALPKSKAKV